MEKLSRILHDLDQGNINVESAKQQVLDLKMSKKKKYYDLAEERALTIAVVTCRFYSINNGKSK